MVKGFLLEPMLLLLLTNNYDFCLSLVMLASVWAYTAYLAWGSPFKEANYWWVGVYRPLQMYVHSMKLCHMMLCIVVSAVASIHLPSPLVRVCTLNYVMWPHKMEQWSFR